MEKVYAYSPYGTSTTLGPDDGNTIQFTGRENDQTGLYYYRARTYDPVLKRFISEDPIGLFGGPNFFAFVEGDPISLTDPLGLQSNYAVVNFFHGAGTYGVGLYQFGKHTAARAGLLGECEERQSRIQGAVMAAALTNPAVLSQLPGAALNYAQNNKARVAGRVFAGVLVSGVLSATLGPYGTALGATLNVAASVGALRGAGANAADIAGAVLGGQVSGPLPGSCGCP